MIARWARPYIGLPFQAGGRTRAGIDCYGLVRLVLGEVFNVALPAYALSWSGRQDWPTLTAALEAGALDWYRLRDGDEARVGDVVLLAVHGHPLHLGLLVDVHVPTMLHVLEGIDSALERLDGPTWAPRVRAFYRWPRQEALCAP
jgi:cell wall-associated NlpC family hydrolase